MFSSHSFWTSSSLDVPAGVTREEGHTGFLMHLFSAVRALLFLARRIQPFLSLVDREVEFCVDLIVLHPLGVFIFIFYFFSEKNPVCRDRTHVPTGQKVTWLPLSYRGDRPQVRKMYLELYMCVVKEADEDGKPGQKSKKSLQHSPPFPGRGS